MLPFIKEHRSVWTFLKDSELPIFIYGMGDGAVKILTVMREKLIPIAGFFASDGFVRGQSFEGYRVHSLAEVEGSTPQFIIVLAFAAGYASLIEQVEEIAARHILLAPDVPVIGNVSDSLFDYDYFLAHESELAMVYDLLADDKSREVFADIINFKISGKISYLSHCTTEREEVYNELLPLSEEEIYLDLGAYDGDTVTEFLEQTAGRYREIFAIEADRKNFSKLTKNVPNCEDIHLINAAAWSGEATLSFQNKAGRNSTLSGSANGIPTPATSVDRLTDSATLIKLDVEGAEKEALIGASRNIKTNAPRLIVALYHRSEDIYALALLLHAMQPRYRFYLRHHAYIPAWETLLIVK